MEIGNTICGQGTGKECVSIVLFEDSIKSNCSMICHAVLRVWLGRVGRGRGGWGLEFTNHENKLPINHSHQIVCLFIKKNYISLCDRLNS